MAGTLSFLEHLILSQGHGQLARLVLHESLAPVEGRLLRLVDGSFILQSIDEEGFFDGDIWPIDPDCVDYLGSYNPTLAAVRPRVVITYKTQF